MLSSSLAALMKPLYSVRVMRGSGRSRKNDFRSVATLLMSLENEAWVSRCTLVESVELG